MIRKDQLPNIWGDDWKVEKAEIREEIIPAGAGVKIVITDNPWMVGLMAGKAICRSSIELIRINMAEESSLELYNIQGMETPQRHLSEIRVTMQQGSRLRMCTVTLGGQHVRNNVIVRMKGEHCELEADGLYLIDREQQCDNYIFVEHAKPNCSSRELYKGIIDERARARFNGHVLEQAKFYLQTRGISERTAITMLSYAFCDEVIRGIGIPELRDTVGDMVKKRLHGELPCDECAIRCSTPCNGEAANFHIDPNKL